MLYICIYQSLETHVNKINVQIRFLANTYLSDLRSKKAPCISIED